MGVHATHEGATWPTVEAMGSNPTKAPLRQKNTLLALQSRDLRPEHSEAMVLAGSAQESIHQRSRSRPVANHDDVSSQHTSGRDQAPKRLSRLDTASMATRPDSSSG